MNLQYYHFWWIVKLLILGTGVATAQVDFPNTYNSIDAEDGLVFQYNSFVEVDSRGWTWIGSFGGGVYLYDGLRAEPLVVDSIIHVSGGEVTVQNIQSDFFEDTKGNIWFASIDGLICYERKTNWLRTYQMKPDANTTFLKSGYCLFYIENDTSLWLKADQQIFNFNPRVQQSEYITDTDGYRFEVDTTTNGRLKTIYACPWISGNGIEQIDLTSEHKLIVRHHLPNGLPGKEGSKLTVSDVFSEHDSLLWMLTNQGLVAFNPRKSIVDSCYQFPNNSTDFSILGTAYKERYLILGAKQSGVWVFDKQTSTFIRNYSLLEDGSNGIPDAQIGEINLSDEQVLWMSGTTKPILSSIWLENNNRFNNPLEQFENSSVLSILEDDRGQVWAATVAGGVFRFTSGGQLIEQFKYRNSGSNKLSPIKHLSKDDKGNIWASSNSTIYIYKEGRWKPVFYKNEISFFSLQHISDENKLLTTNSGLFQLSKKTNNAWSIEAVEIENNENLKVFYSYHSKRKGSFYCSVNGKTLLELVWREQQLVIGKEYEIEADVYSISESSTLDQLLLSTDKGPKVLDLKNSTITNPESPVETNGIPGYAFFEDSNNNCWLVNNAGIWKFTTTNEPYEVYRLQDGIPSVNWKLYADLLSSENILWLGSEVGLTLIDLDSIRPYPHLPKVELTNLRVDNSPYKKAGNIAVLEELNLKYNQNAIDLRLLALTQYNSQFNLVKYRLLNGDTTWYQVKTGEDISLNTPPGSYTLEMKGVNANGLEGKIKRLVINIGIPVWERWWFWLIGFVLTGVLFKLVVNNASLRKQRKQMERQQAISSALQTERKRIGADMHEELGGELTSIQLIAKKVPQDELNAANSKRINNIIKHAEDSVTNIREIIWAMNDNYDSLPDLAIYMRRFVADYFSELEMKYKIHIGDLPDIVISGSQRSNIFRCVKETVHNIVKHAQASETYFSVNFDDDVSILRIHIKDNGRGLPEGESEEKYLGNGLKNMKKRMASINGQIDFKNEDGLSVLFSIPLEQPKVTN